MNKTEEGLRVVTCLVCGSEVTTLATKGFVATIIHEPGEDEISFKERIRCFQKQLSLFTDVV